MPTRKPAPARQPSAATDLLAFDIGGATIKAADGRGWTASLDFPLWRRWRELPAALAGIVAKRRPERIVATMTGEICDCYPSRAAGVRHIVASLIDAARGFDDVPGVYLTDGRVVPATEAEAAWQLAAAANWHALARLAASVAGDHRSLLLDIGSTTTDIVPLDRGRVAATACDDAGRMLAGELVYTGVERTAVASLVRRLPHRGRQRPVVSELFAESRDAWLTLGCLPEAPASTSTADGGPATIDAARIRLARTMLLDPADFTAADATTAAEAIATRQAGLIARALRRVAGNSGHLPETVVLTGHGDQLAFRALAATGWPAELLRLADTVGPAAARSAPAFALAGIVRGMIP